MPAPGPRLRFGPFDLDLRAGELLRDGNISRLQQQPLMILKMLVERPGHLVTREEIRRALWPNDTIVEFDQSINTAIKKLRLALGDSAERPLYVETVGRRGYRLIIPVSWPDSTPGRVSGKPADYAQSPAETLIGKKVSHYRVLHVLGGGGMGVVYAAEDLKLGRRVALKFLPQELVGDVAAMHRFEREARAASALNHPHICVVYAVDEFEQQQFIVMELLEGRTLREIIADAGADAGQSAIPLSWLYRVSIQIADGLAAAHQKGIIHRDIKPANIFITNHGQAKILDFGLAKRHDVDTDDAVGAASNARSTESNPLLTITREGITVGTAAYMSPEQVRGEKLDSRTDLFSFGLVIYEMATGRRAFDGDTAPVLHQAILSDTPAPVRSLNSKVPKNLEGVISKAIRKDRERRYQSAKEMRDAFEFLEGRLKPFRFTWQALAACILLLTSVLAMWLFNLRGHSYSPKSDLKLRQLTTNSPDNPLRSGMISPDGKYLVYSDLKGMKIKTLTTGEVRLIAPGEQPTGKEGSDWYIPVAWLPDGTRFLVNIHPAKEEASELMSDTSSMWMFSLTGGTPRQLHDHAVAYGVSPDGSEISFGMKGRRDGEGELWLMDIDGSNARRILKADTDSSICCLTWSPDGSRFGYIKNSASEGVIGLSQDVRGGPPSTLFPRAEMEALYEMVWLHDGRLVYGVRESDAFGSVCNYWIKRIDWRTGKVIDPPTRLTNWTSFCASSGSVTADDRRLAFLGWSTHRSVYLADSLASGAQIRNARQFTADESDNLLIDWTPDSRSIVFASNRSGKNGIYTQGLSEETPRLVVKEPNRSARVTPDGKWIVWITADAKGPNDRPQLMRTPIEGGLSEPIFPVSSSAFSLCARPPSNLCVIAEKSEHKDAMIFTSFDPLKGRGPELLRIPLSADAYGACDLSPDGSRIAAIVGPDDPIQIFSLQGKPQYAVRGRGLDHKMFVSWAADGKGLFITHQAHAGSELAHVDAKGTMTVVEKQRWISSRELAVARWPTSSYTEFGV